MWQCNAVSEFTCASLLTWLSSPTMWFQSRSKSWPLLTIESPVALWSEHLARSWRVVGSNPIWDSHFSNFVFLRAFPISKIPKLLVSGMYFCFLDFYSRLFTMLWHFFHFQIVPLWPRCRKNLLHFSGDWSVYSMASWVALSKKSMFKTIYFLFMFTVEREWLTVQTLFLIRWPRQETETVVSGKNTKDRQTDR